MIEYNPKENRFPFHTKDKAVSLCFDDTEDIQELDFIYGKIVERYPDLKAENFYTRLMEIERMKSGDKVKYLKASCDNLLGHVKEFLPCRKKWNKRIQCGSVSWSGRMDIPLHHG